MLTYKRSDCLEMKVYIDSNYGGCPDDSKSTSGCIFILAKGVVSWKSVKKNTYNYFNHGGKVYRGVMRVHVKQFG